MFKKNRSKIFIGAVWILIIVAVLSFWKRSNISLSEIPILLETWLTNFGFLNAALIYIIIYTLRPIIFFPGMWLSIASGLIFGPWFGILFTIVGANMSAVLAFVIARYLGRGWVKSKETGIIKKWDHRLCSNGLVTVMIMRLLYLPYDAVNYGCGLTSMKMRDFIIGTVIGTIPGTITFVLLGGSLSPQASGIVMILGLDISQRLFVFLLLVFFFVFGLVIAKFIHKYMPDTCEV